jgi:hypothetical protein
MAFVGLREVVNNIKFSAYHSSEVSTSSTGIPLATRLATTPSFVVGV